MSAELLREAAAKIRERANAATPGPWTVDVGTHDFSSVEIPHVRYTNADQTYTTSVAPAVWPRNVSHVASWHPAVALAVADWLKHEAVSWRRDEEVYLARHFEAWLQGNDGTMPPETRAHFERISVEFADGQHRDALAVARAYLGMDR